MPTHDYQYFTIDSVTGVIRTTQIFDREIAEQAHLLIDVKATDKGSPQRSDTTFVDIEVIDDNDMAPVFETTDYSLEVDEDVPLGEVLYFFTVKDNDVALNSIVNFFISEGNQDQAFDVITKFKPNGGELIVEDKLDFETTKTYRLKIIASDGRSASQTANVNIKVRNIFLFKQWKGEQYVELCCSTLIGCFTGKIFYYGLLSQKMSMKNFLNLTTRKQIKFLMGRDSLGILFFLKNRPL